jgi:hypothetical protein
LDPDGKKTGEETDPNRLFMCKPTGMRDHGSVRCINVIGNFEAEGLIVYRLL